MALFGASELFAQLDEMKPRQPRKRRGKKGSGRKRRNDILANQADTSASSPSSANNTSEQLDGYSMNLFGSSELFAQLTAENGLERSKHRW